MKLRKLLDLHRGFIGSILFWSASLGANGAAPFIQYQPQDQTVILHQPAAFGVIASGSGPLSYQWRKSGVPIVGSTQDQIVLAHARFSDAGLYSVEVSNAEGTTTSAEVQLIVNPPRGGDIDFQFPVDSAVNSAVYSLAKQPDGKVLIAGFFNAVNGALHGGIARLNADGTTDQTFRYGRAGEYFTVYSAVVQGDGKILIAGNFTTVNGVARNRIARLERDGSLDTGFLNGLPGADDYVWCMALQSDGKVLIGGSFTNVNGVKRTGIARLNTDGTLDTSFQGGLPGLIRISVATPPAVYSIAVQADGKAIIGGYFLTRDAAGFTNANLARLNVDGTFDDSFRNGTNKFFGTGVYDGFVRSVAAQSDGKVIIGGDFTGVHTGPYQGRVARLNADGTLDSSFRADVSGSVRAVALQNDGRIVIGGVFDRVSRTPRYCVARLNQNGSCDTSFQDGLSGVSGGVALSGPIVFAFEVQNDGNVIVGGGFAKVNDVERRHVARLKSDGTLDVGFRNGGLVADHVIYSVAVQGDDKVLIGGDFATIHGVNRTGIARLNTDGTLDAGFRAVTNASGVRAIALQSDGKVLIGGYFFEVNGVSRNRIARLHPDGSLDRSFLEGLSGVRYSQAFVTSIAVQNDGKILIGGRFDSVNEVSRVNIARLNADGTLDSFQNGLSRVSGGLLNVRSIALQSDGKVLIGGDFSMVNGIGRTNIARLHPDGTLDTQFQNGLSGANGSVYSVVVQGDGKILIGGLFDMVNGIHRPGIARLNVDGTLDSSFPNGFSEVDYVVSLALQKDGKLLIGGVITDNGMGRTNIARLNPDGTLDRGFQDGLPGASGWVLSIGLQSDGKVLIGGGFNQVNGVLAPSLARLWGSGDIPPQFRSIQRSSGAMSMDWYAISNRTYRVQYKEELSGTNWSNLPGDVPAMGGTASKTDSSLSNAPQRFYRVQLLP